MPDPNRAQWRGAVDAAVPVARPDFAAVYTRSHRRNQLRWTGLGMVAAVAAALAVLLVQPPAPPSFDNQVAAFVELVYSD